MIDLPLVLCAGAYLVLGFAYGWLIVELMKNNIPGDWRGQWWLFAVIGIAAVVLTVYFIWNWARPNMVMSSQNMIDMILIDTIILFVAALPGIAGWQVADAMGQMQQEARQENVKEPAAHTLTSNQVDELTGHMKRAADSVSKFAKSQNGVVAPERAEAHGNG